MSLLQDPVFTLFGGESITGRAPVSMRVIGRDLSGEQRDWAVREFAAFKSACRISIVPLQTKWVKLRDGTVMQMASNAGTDRVVIWPAGGSDSFGPGLYLLWSEEQTLDGSMPPQGTHAGGTVKWGTYQTEGKPEDYEDFVSVGARANHPGCVTWSSPNFTAVADGEEREVQLSWRGPGSRYFDPLMTTLNLSKYVWINGVAVKTGVDRVISAALHTVSEGNVILRVCSDRYPLDSSTPGCVTVDLVPEGVDANDCTLQKILHASRFTVDASYPATDYEVPAGSDITINKWHPMQWPYFDGNGERVAMIVLTRDSGAIDDPDPIAARDIGHRGVIFSATEWTQLQRIDPGTQANATGAFGAYGYYLRGWSESSNVATEFTVGCLLAVDFLDNTPVWVMGELKGSSTSSGSRSGRGPTSINASWSLSKNTEVSATHSIYGELFRYSLASSASNAGSGGYTSASGGATFLGKMSGSSTGEPNICIAFVGDLSRDIFAIGWSPGLASDGVSYSGGGYSTIPYASANVSAYQKHKLRYKYDVYLAGVKVADQVDGGTVDISEDSDEMTTTTPGATSMSLNFGGADEFDPDPDNYFTISEPIDSNLGPVLLDRFIDHMRIGASTGWGEQRFDNLIPGLSTYPVGLPGMYVIRDGFLGYKAVATDTARKIAYLKAYATRSQGLDILVRDTDEPAYAELLAIEPFPYNYGTGWVLSADQPIFINPAPRQIMAPPT